MAPKKKKDEAAGHESVVVPDQFKNTNDWPLFRAKTLYRGKPYGDGYVLADNHGAVSFVSQEEMTLNFEPVPEGHKRAF
jgi:hypothetical protein